MKRIPLTQGKFTLVDDEDFEWLNSFKWQHSHSTGNPRGYAKRNLNYKVEGVWKSTVIYLHRFLMNPPPNLQVDHINGDKLDNRRDNLRLVSQRENLINKPKRSDSRNRYKGISTRPSGTFYANIKVHGKYIYLGTYTTAEEAARAYDEAARKYFGAISSVNFSLLT